MSRRASHSPKAKVNFLKHYRTPIIIVSSLLLLAFFCFWNYSQVNKGDSTFFDERAHREPYYAASEFLSKENARFRYIIGQRFLSTLSFKGDSIAKNDTLFLSSKVRFSKDLDIEPVLSWVEEGGTLVISTDSLKIQSEGRDELLDRLSLYADLAKDVFSFPAERHSLPEPLANIVEETVTVGKTIAQECASTGEKAVKDTNTDTNTNPSAKIDQSASDAQASLELDEACVEQRVLSTLESKFGTDREGENTESGERLSEKDKSKNVNIEASDIEKVVAHAKELSLFDQSSEGFFRYASGQQRATPYFRGNEDRWHYCRYSRYRHSRIAARTGLAVGGDSPPNRTGSGLSLQSGYSMAVKMEAKEELFKSRPVDVLENTVLVGHANSQDDESVGSNAAELPDSTNVGWSTVLGVSSGKGRIVFLPGEHMFTNPLLPCADNASFLQSLVATGSSLWLIDFFSEPDFWDKLWLLVPYSLILFACAIVVLLWHGLVRFGPAFDFRYEQKRSFREALRAKAALFYRYGDMPQHVSTHRKRLLAKMQLRHLLSASELAAAQSAEDTPALETPLLTTEGVQALASRLKLSPQVVIDAFNTYPENKRRSIVTIMRAIKDCNNALGRSL